MPLSRVCAKAVIGADRWFHIFTTRWSNTMEHEVHCAETSNCINNLDAVEGVEVQVFLLVTVECGVSLDDLGVSC